jgi:serine protease Do
MRRVGPAAAVAALVGALLLGTPAAGAGGPSAAVLPDFAALISKEAAVVVRLVTTSTGGATTPMDADEDGFDGSLIDGAVVLPSGAPFGRRPQRNLASGVIVASDGYILTSAHAVGTFDEISVRLSDGRDFAGRVLGIDARTDIALVKIDANELPVAVIGDPAQLAIGEWVVAIGAPFGLDASVTAGIVSAKRFLPGSSGTPVIQTDVAINQGSSGGPLFNLRGEVVGINSMIFTATGAFMGISFALPIDSAMQAADELRRRGYIVRGRLGAHLQELSIGLARAFGRVGAEGALVTRVAADAQGGDRQLRVGDIILGFGDGSALSFSAIQQRVAASVPGTRVTLDVWRDSQAIRLVTQVGAADATGPMPPPAAAALRPTGDRLGLVLEEVRVERTAEPNAARGLVIREAHGIALRAGLAPGDRILAVNQRMTGSLAEYRFVVSRLAPGAHVALLVMRDGRLAYVALQSAPVGT